MRPHNSLCRFFKKNVVVIKIFTLPLQKFNNKNTNIMYNFTEQGKDLNQVINETERFLESLLEGKSLPVQKRYLTQTLKEEQELYNKMEKAQKSDGWLHGEIVQYSDVLIQKEIVWMVAKMRTSLD